MKQYMVWISYRWSIALWLAIATQAGAAPPVAISFGVVPQQSTTKLARLWLPIVKYLSVQTGYTLMFKTAKDIPTFERRLAAGTYDIAYMNPYHYTIFSRSPGYRAFAKTKNAAIRGIIIVRKDSPYQTLDELAGQTLAFPSPAAFAASVLPRRHLLERDVVFTPDYVSSHDSVYHGVVRGFYAAGGGIARTLNNMPAAIQNELRILWTSKPYTPHAIAAHPRVPAEVVERVQQVMEAMHADPAGRALLQAIRFYQGIESARDSEWDDVRHLGIQLLQNLTRH